MRQMKCLLVVTAVMAMFTNSRVIVAQDFIQPTVNLTLPEITFDSNINPVVGTLSNDALNIIRAHSVAMQEVQAALQYLRLHRFEIMEGKNTWYNQVFGDFYNPNNAYAGLYNRTVKVGDVDKLGQPVLDRFGHQITHEEFNTANFDRVFNVFLRIQEALNEATTYSWGAQPSVAANQMIFDTYRTTIPTVGDPLYGNAALTSPLDNGTMQWGYSTSYTPGHLAQIATNPNNPLRWDLDNNVGGTLTPAQELAFFRDRLDAYAIPGTVAGTDPVTGAATTTNINNIYIGGAFLNELMRSDSSVTGQPNPFFIPTELKQYQQIIAALAQSAGSLGYDVVTIQTHTVIVQTVSGGSGNNNNNSSGNGSTTTITDSTKTGVTTDSSSFKAGTTTTTTTSSQSSSTGGGSGSGTGGNGGNGGQNQTVTTTTTTTTTITITREAVAIQPGLAKLFGQNAYFMSSLDATSFALFADLFKPVSEGGIGDGTLLPPPGKIGTHADTFFPVVPGA